jgi:hypothetical protein
LGGKSRFHARPRPLAAMGYVVNGPVIDGLIDVEDLHIVILCDEQFRRGQCALRLAGFSVSRIPWGIRFGGPGNCTFLKDLRLQPVPQGRGYRLDLADTELLTLGLQLERELDRQARYRQGQVQNVIRLPKLWAGFRAQDARAISGDGPELAAYARRTARSPQQLLEHLRRDHRGLVIYPLAWVSHLWEKAVSVFADLDGFPRRQVFGLNNAADDSVGFQGACEYDFRPGQVRPRVSQSGKMPSRPLVAA